MNVRNILALFFVLPAMIAFAQKKQVCFTYDDLPVVSYGMNDSSFQKALTAKLIGSLKSNNIPAIGFVNETKLYDASGKIHFQVEMLRSWVDNGLTLGNHTFSHPDYNNLSFSDFTRDILRGEKVTRLILESTGSTIKYFRHPFLHTGHSKAKADSLDRFLQEHGYTTAPVTIDNEDYLFALAYKRAKVSGDPELMKRIGTDYVDYMEKKLKYFEKQAHALFGRDIKHILLLHASLLNADYTDSLAAMYRKNNYDFITIEKALEDSAYETDVTVFGKWGISWIDRWALSQGKKGDFFRDEPATPEYIVKMAQLNKN